MSKVVFTIDDPKATGRQAAERFAATNGRIVASFDGKEFRLIDGRNIYSVEPNKSNTGWEIHLIKES